MYFVKVHAVKMKYYVVCKILESVSAMSEIGNRASETSWISGMRRLTKTQYIDFKHAEWGVMQIQISDTWVIRTTTK